MQFLTKFGNLEAYFNCENEVVQNALDSRNPLVLKQFFGENKLIILDEAQYIENIGFKLKILIDTYPDLQIIATGSSSFELANQINEPLTGRSLEFVFFSFSVRELEEMFKAYSEEKLLERFLRFGALFENFCILERYKKLQREEVSFNSYFWKTYDQKEIDFVEEREGRLFGYEIKWNNKRKVKAPKEGILRQMVQNNY